MIDQLWIQPPLAFARLGPSPKPCDNYRWGRSDLTPRGTGKTTVEPQPTLDLAADGTLSERMPQEVRFKDEAGWRPVCPYFEVHGSWTVDGERHTGPLTEEVLARFGLGLGDVRWQVSVANLKAHHLTRSDDDRIEATVGVRGDDHQQHRLAGTSPQGAAQPLVPAGRDLPLGAVQVPVPNAALPELRLRFTPATGAVYGPTTLTDAGRYRIPAERRILNPGAEWVGFRLPSDDVRTAPRGLFAGAEGQLSLGLVDDVCDGLVTVGLPGGLTASARVVACPPVFSPDRRPFVSVADGLADRVRRGDVRTPAYLADKGQTTQEIRDLFERILETVGNINLDVQNGFFGALPPAETLTGVLLGLTEQARRRHRRFVALEMLEDLFRERPGLIREIVREPVADPRTAGAYNGRMPPDMRGADGNALHLTRRQYDLLVRWAAALRENTEAGT
ncbi:hypothetical protein ACWGKW_09915 [Streptomyces sp. NPDC054766]|uniref:hypothetical protein n=1 Tax=Streptomyces rhizosphaerihabitans TaxID=1266770 RepID=UPI0021C0ECC8|nr:hypothetical protein [Streptomyces rhizosphaerihabitans]MCT9005893.1 hypothetical protein [Streptomyces rhizosphaerihabitans]